MFPKFIHVGLYLGVSLSEYKPTWINFGNLRGAYIRDVNWVTYLGAYIRGGLYTGGRINEILRCQFTRIHKSSPIKIEKVFNIFNRPIGFTMAMA